MISNEAMATYTPPFATGFITFSMALAHLGKKVTPYFLYQNTIGISFEDDSKTYSGYGYVV